MAFGRDGLTEQPRIDFASLSELTRANAVVWIDVQGTGDVALLRQLGEQFGLHRLALEDVVNSHQRAKVEDYGTHEFVVLRMVDQADIEETEQFAMFVGPGFVLSFQERAGDCFDMVRQRIRDAASQIRSRGSDYLAYALLDAVVDGYFPVVEHIGELLESIEEHMLEDSRNRENVAELHHARRTLVNLRRVIWPLREVASTLMRGEVRHFSAEVRIYLRDVHDHVIRLLDLLETHRELAGGLLELHLTMVNYRLNEVMKVLTIIATIFIPLTFLAGVYGMNFENMPELRAWWGYPACLLVMALVAGGMLLWFRRRGWL